MMQHYTNGMYTPIMHRVANADPERSRISVPFFYEPNFEAVVQPLPQFAAPGEQPMRYEPLQYGSWLEGRVLRNFEL